MAVDTRRTTRKRVPRGPANVLSEYVEQADRRYRPSLSSLPDENLCITGAYSVAPALFSKLATSVCS